MNLAVKIHNSWRDDGYFLIYNRLFQPLVHYRPLMVVSAISGVRVIDGRGDVGFEEI